MEIVREVEPVVHKRKAFSIFTEGARVQFDRNEEVLRSFAASIPVSDERRETRDMEGGMGPRKKSAREHLDRNLDMINFIHDYRVNE